MQLPRLQRDSPFALTIRVLQFGQGNFLRGFVDWQLDILNACSDGDFGVVVVRPTSRSTAPLLDTQGGCYTTVLRGLDAQGELQTQVRKITCVQRELDLEVHYADYLALAHSPDILWVVSNTTEAGIVVGHGEQYADQPPLSFPAKLTRWLHERYTHFQGNTAKGVVLLPCELIEANGPALQAAVRHYSTLWQLAPEFETWLDQSCHFCSTLVDRIVTGYPTDSATQLQSEWGYQDDFVVAGELYHYWAIEAPAWVKRELPLERAGLNVHWVDDLAPIRLRKVAILNGAHTLLASVGLHMGMHTVGDAMRDPDLRRFLEAALYEEVIPALPFLQAESRAYAGEVLRRFANPYIQHQLTAIALNMESKCVTRLLPQIRQFHQQHGYFPPRLTLGLAAAIQGLKEPCLQIDGAMDAIPGLHDAVNALRARIAAVGMRTALQRAGVSA